MDYDQLIIAAIVCVWPLTRSDTHITVCCSIVIKASRGESVESSILQGLAHQFLKALCNFLNIVNDQPWGDAGQKSFAKTGNWIELGSKVPRQCRSPDLCNIVDHRKLVSLINNEEKTNRGVSLVRYLATEDGDMEKWGFPKSSAQPCRPSWMTRHKRSQFSEEKQPVQTCVSLFL